ncbi:restriction endonuclease subunit S [Chryseobacterium binzhouense]|uniref:restriction endonuclease subunit S n=1 Tax=Chryseobacterium binzhouense TaxID=2593646 RepID=UPI00117C93C6|nr:restriction endonuclease subunit S [Chryseobacterium binzhouense]
MKKQDTNMGNFPNLRFPEFEGEWEMKKLGDVGDVKMCRRIFNDETSTIGEIPFFKIGSFGKKADAFISKNLYLDYKNRFPFPKKGDILISAAGTIGRTVIYNGEDAYYQDSNIVWIDNDNAKVINEFLFHILQIVKYNTEGGTIQRLYNNILKSTKFNCPTILEQKKISNFLDIINTRIQTQKKIIEQLETLMKESRENIFLQKIRFKDDDFSKWEEKKLGDILIESNEKSIKNNQHRVISSTAKGLFHQDDYFTRDIASQDNTGYKILKKQQLVFSPQNLWLGNININMDFEIGLVSPSYKIFNFNTNLTSHNYCNFFLKTSLMLFEYAQSSIQGASVVRRNLDLNMFYNIKILLPSKKEQTKIANFLSSIQEKIEMEKQILKKLELQKKFLLANLFV